MARLKVKGLDELIRKTEEAGRDPTELVKRALWEGAGLMAGAIRVNVSGIPTGGKREITATEKAGLLKGIGISRMRDEGIGQVSLVIGFNGTNSDGERNTTIMRRVESGSLSVQKHPTVRPAKNHARKPALAAMQKQFEKDLKDMFS